VQVEVADRGQEAAANPGGRIDRVCMRERIYLHGPSPGCEGEGGRYRLEAHTRVALLTAPIMACVKWGPMMEMAGDIWLTHVIPEANKYKDS
jgi:hypothetical protein